MCNFFFLNYMKFLWLILGRFFNFEFLMRSFLFVIVWGCCFFMCDKVMVVDLLVFSVILIIWIWLFFVLFWEWRNLLFELLIFVCVLFFCMWFWVFCLLFWMVYIIMYFCFDFLFFFLFGVFFSIGKGVWFKKCDFFLIVLLIFGL